jgi:cytoskeletal protein CcmA (bactofilin family)
MIRMGRSSKTEQPTHSAADTSQQPVSSYQYTSEMPSRSVVSDSDAMARDIKEGRLSGFIGYGTTLSGEASFQAMLRIDGQFTGRISSEAGTLIVGSTGQVDANVTVVNGTVNGDIIAAEKIELGRTARVVGNIRTPRLVIDDGAILEGGCSMLKAREATDKRSAETDLQPTVDKFSSYRMNGLEEDSDLSDYEQNKQSADAIVS